VKLIASPLRNVSTASLARMGEQRPGRLDVVGSMHLVRYSRGAGTSLALLSCFAQ
jgi:hypothetical protein